MFSKDIFVLFLLISFVSYTKSINYEDNVSFTVFKDKSVGFF